MCFVVFLDAKNIVCTIKMSNQVLMYCTALQHTKNIWFGEKNEVPNIEEDMITLVISWRPF